MKDDMQIYHDSNKLNGARNCLHTLYKDLSEGYMHTQVQMKDSNLSTEQFNYLLKTEYTFINCLRQVNQLNLMLDKDAYTYPRIEQHNVCEVLRAIVKTLNDILFVNTGVQIVFRQQGENIQARLDVPGIERILFSIIENTLQHGPENAKILISIKQKEKNLHIIIKEKSSAIPEKDFSVLFHKYTTVTSGTLDPNIRQGLSLALAKQTAAEMDGSLTAENQKTGLKFTLILPFLSGRVREKDFVYTLLHENVIYLFADYLAQKLRQKLIQAGISIADEI